MTHTVTHAPSVPRSPKLAYESQKQEVLVGKGAQGPCQAGYGGWGGTTYWWPQDLGGDSGGGGQERELGRLSAEWPRTGTPSGLCFGDPLPAHRPVSFQVAAALKEVTPEPLVSREDSVPDTPWHSSPESLLLSS